MISSADHHRPTNSQWHQRPTSPGWPGHPTNPGWHRRPAGVFIFTTLLLLSQSPLTQAAEPLTHDGRLKRDPVFAGPDGQTLVYVLEERPVQWRLMRLRLADGTSEPLHPDQTKTEFEPAFSPDGRYLAFVQSRGNLSLALVIRDLTENSTAEVNPPGGFAGMSSPALSPDGTRVAYSLAEEGRQSIFSVTNKAEDRRKLIDSPGVNNWPGFSPDGRSLVFASTRDGNYEIYRAAADGTAPRRLTDQPSQDIRPRFSPDGRQIAFTSTRDGNSEIYVMNADGTNVRRVTHHDERDDYPAWHPDGKRLVIVSERRGRHDLYLVDVP